MAQVDYFLKIAGVDGESTDDKHKGEIELIVIVTDSSYCAQRRVRGNSTGYASRSLCHCDQVGEHVAELRVPAENQRDQRIDG